MTPQSPAALAYALASGQDQAAAEAALAALPAAEAMLSLTDAAFAGAGWARIGAPRRGIPYLMRDWTEAPPDTAGLAGAVLLSLGHVDVALSALKRAVVGSSRDRGAHLVNLGRALTLSGQPEEALAQLQAARGLVRHDASLALRSLAEALVALGRGTEALALLPAETEDEAVIAARCAVLCLTGQHADAAALLREALQRQPEATGLLILAAELCEVRGRSHEAAALLRRAVDKDPGSVALWARLAQTGRRGSFGPAAVEAAETAMRLAEGAEPHLRALALGARAHVLGETGDTAGAEAAWRDCLALMPGAVTALSGLGNLLLQVGRVDEALDCFRQLRAAAPLRGWAQLIHAREVPDDPAVLEELECAARQPSLEGAVRSGMLFTLASAWDRKKDYARAFALAHEANEASKALLPYDPAVHRAQVVREMSFFSAPFMASRAGWGHPSRLPVFVLGMPRSGTTLVEQILSGHSRVHGAGELGQVGELIQRLCAWQMKLGSGIGYPACVADLTPDDLKRHAEYMLRALLALAGDGVSHVIDKLPHNFEHVGLIKLLFPNAAIIHVRREPRDIAVSNYIADYAAKFGGMGFAYDLRWIGEQLVDHDRLMAHWHRVLPGQILEVPYEALIEDTEGWARQMCGHLGLPWEPPMLEFQNLDRPVKTASVWQVRQPIYKTSKARWRRYADHLDPLGKSLAQIPPNPTPLPIPTHAPGLFEAAMAALQADRAVDAEERFRALITQYPQHAAGHHFLGAALLRQSRADEALNYIRRSVRLWPRHASWFDNLGMIEERQGNYDEAARAKTRAEQLRNVASSTGQ